MPDKQPTNAEILQEVQAMSGRLLVIEDWKRSEDAYRAALAQVKAEEKESKTTSQNDDFMKRRTEIMKQVGIVLGLIAAILYAYASTRGVPTP